MVKEGAAPQNALAYSHTSSQLARGVLNKLPPCTAATHIVIKVEEHCDDERRHQRRGDEGGRHLRAAGGWEQQLADSLVR